MTNVMRLLPALALLTFAAVASAKPPVPATQTGGALVLSSTTDGAEVYVDGEKVGTVPLPGPIPLRPGEHTIKVQKAGFAPLIDVFRISRKGQTSLEVELVPISGAIKVRVNVEKARVFIDGKFVCEAPCTSEMSVGARAIQVSKGGYKDFFQNVASVAGQELALDVKLEDLPLGLNPYKPAPPPPARWHEKWWVWTLVGLGAGGVVAAIVVPVNESQRDRVGEFAPHYTFTVGAQ